MSYLPHDEFTRVGELNSDQFSINFGNGMFINVIKFQLKNKNKTK